MCKYFLQRLYVTARSVVFVNHVDHVLTFKSNNVLQTRFSRGFVASIYEIIGPVGWETVSKKSCIVIDKQLVVVKNDGHRARAVQLWKLCMADESLDRPSGRFRFIFRII